MATDHSVAVHKALYAALDGNISAPVFDGPRPDGTFPYVVINDSRMVPDDTKVVKCGIYRVSIDVWSRDAGQNQAKAILAEIYGILHAVDATIAGAGAWTLENQYVFRDADFLTVHGVADYSLFITN
jgi:hypothetical protein